MLIILYKSLVQDMQDMWKWQKEHLNNLKQNLMSAEAH